MPLIGRVRRRFWEEPRIDRAYPRWVRRQAAVAAPAAGDGPRISVLMPVHETRADWLAAAIGSVQAQTYGNWELCIADDASAGAQVGEVLRAAAADARMQVTHLPERRGIAGATNAAAGLASGKYVAFMDHDDMLAPEALGVMAAAATAHPQAGLLFSDEDQIVDGLRRAPYFKPGWNPDLLLQQNLVCHLAVCRRAVFDALGGMRAGFEGAQDHDFALRAWAHLGDAGVRHVPGILYHWRQDRGSFSAVAAARCREAAGRAIAAAAGAGARLEADADLPGWERVVFAAPADVRVAVMRPGEGEAAEADVLVFVSETLRAEPGAVAALVGQVMRPGVGVAGGLIADAAGRVVHGGFALHAARVAVGAVGMAGDPGYRGRFRLARAVAAVSGECLAVRREVFGGWRKEAGDFADVDLCLRAAEAGWRSVWTPAARFVGAVRRPVRGAAWMRAHWGARLAHDPYINPHLAAHSGRLSL